MTRTLFAITAALLVGVPVAGHHSFAAYYFEEQSVTIEGEVAEFDYRAPHAWLHVKAPDTQGQVRRFSAEWANPRRLMGDGVTRDTLKAGDRVIVTGSPGRTASDYKLHLKQVRRPADGWEWGMRRGGARRR
jgi:exonuclease VII large subunit